MTCGLRRVIVDDDLLVDPITRALLRSFFGEARRSHGHRGFHDGLGSATISTIALTSSKMACDEAHRSAWSSSSFCHRRWGSPTEPVASAFCPDWIRHNCVSKRGPFSGLYQLMSWMCELVT